MKIKKLFTSIFAPNVKKQLKHTHQCTLKERIPSNRGYRDDLKCIHDSSMEANIHRFYIYLMNKHHVIKEVVYEPKPFKFPDNEFNVSYYIPDFKITDNSGVRYIEVKGYMDKRAKIKKHLMRKYYPNVKLQFILPENYKRIFNNYGNIVKNWE